MSRSPIACARWIVILSLAVVATAASAAAPTRPAELLMNPGFEDALEAHPWMPAGWDTSQTDLATVFFGRDTFLVHGGKYSVNVANTSTLVPAWHNWNQSVIIGPEAWGKDAVFSVWTRSNGQQGRAYILLQAYRDTVGKMAKQWGLPRDVASRRMMINKLDDPLLDYGWKRNYFTDTETDWVRREVRVFVPPSTDMLYVRCGLLGTGQVIFDDASLTLEPARPEPPLPAHTNLLADPGFEGDGNLWEYSMPPYAGQRIDRDTTQAHSGRACIRYTSGDEGLVQARAGVCQVLDRRLAGKRVKLSAWVKTDSLRNGMAYVRLYCNSLSQGTVQSDPGPSFSLTTDWTPVSFEMDVPPDAYEVWAWFAYNVPASGHAYYDDTSLEIVGPAAASATGAASRPATKPAPRKLAPGKLPATPKKPVR